MEEDGHAWVADEDGEECRAELRLYFEFTSTEWRWLKACAEASGKSVVDMIDRFTETNDDGAWVFLGSAFNLIRRASEIVELALAPYAARFPAPSAFRVERRRHPHEAGWTQTPIGWYHPQYGYEAVENVPTLFLPPSTNEEWNEAADRWRDHLTQEGRDSFNLALGAAAAMNGALCKEWIDKAAKCVVEE